MPIALHGWLLLHEGLSTDSRAKIVDQSIPGTTPARSDAVQIGREAGFAGGISFSPSKAHSNAKF
jgi:hypothetical protein